MKHVTEFDDAVELIQPLYDLLTTGETPEGVTIGELPTFSAEQAFSLIWFLQEVLRVLPDHVEMCKVCNQLFDTHQDGEVLGWSGEVDDWRERQGVTEEMIREHEGTPFCSEGCEASFWRNVRRNSH